MSILTLHMATNRPLTDSEVKVLNMQDQKRRQVLSVVMTGDDAGEWGEERRPGSNCHLAIDFDPEYFDMGVNAPQYGADQHIAHMVKTIMPGAVVEDDPVFAGRADGFIVTASDDWSEVL